jgi:GNAT superfamily N-acetyltransferase
MIREINHEHLNDINKLLQQYSDHIGEETQSLTVLRNQFAQGQKEGSHVILVNTGLDGVAKGFLVYNLKTNRISVIFGNRNFENEKDLLDEAMTRFTDKSSSLIFESGYPIPWISDHLSDYALEKGFEKHDRGYMRLEPINLDFTVLRRVSADLEFVKFTKAISSEISKLVFKSVDLTTDQKLFPSIYSSAATTERFLNQLLSGQYGTHKDTYSWILKEKSEFIGACFLITRDDTGFLVHVVINPDKRRKGFGRLLLLHSFQNLLKIDKAIKRIELAVTWANPAKNLYESLGFKIVNRSTTFIWN